MLQLNYFNSKIKFTAFRKKNILYGYSLADISYKKVLKILNIQKHIYIEYVSTFQAVIFNDNLQIIYIYTIMYAQLRLYAKYLVRSLNNHKNYFKNVKNVFMFFSLLSLKNINIYAYLYF